MSVGVDFLVKQRNKVSMLPHCCPFKDSKVTFKHAKLFVVIIRETLGQRSQQVPIRTSKADHKA